jgi:hypothetical protein
VSDLEHAGVVQVSSGLVRRGFESGLGVSLKACGALIAAGFVLVAVGCGGDDEEATAQGRQPPKLEKSIVVEGGKPRERALLQRAAGGMQKTTITRIKIAPPRARRKTDRGTAVPITFTLVAGGPSVRRQWDQWIVAGAFSRRLHAAGLSAEVDGTGPAGGFTARPKLPRRPDPRPLSKREEAGLVKGIRGAVRRAGGTDVRVEIQRPYGAAVEVSLASEESASFLKNKLRPLIARLESYRPRLEGIYLAVLDERRRLALEWGVWTRNPAGTYWVRRDLANCSPIRQSEPPGTEPPPDCAV